LRQLFGFGSGGVPKPAMRQWPGRATRPHALTRHAHYCTILNEKGRCCSRRKQVRAVGARVRKCARTVQPQRPREAGVATAHITAHGRPAQAQHPFPYASASDECDSEYFWETRARGCSPSSHNPPGGHCAHAHGKLCGGSNSFHTAGGSRLPHRSPTWAATTAPDHPAKQSMHKPARQTRAHTQRTAARRSRGSPQAALGPLGLGVTMLAVEAPWGPTRSRTRALIPSAHRNMPYCCRPHSLAALPSVPDQGAGGRGEGVDPQTLAPRHSHG
jgi:hypothetical protein